jgi:putative heme transporter
VPGIVPRASTAGSRYFVSVAEEIAIPGAGRNLKDILRYVAGVAAGIVVLLLLFGKRAEFAAAWNRLGGFTPGWLAAAVAAEAGSLWLYARLQHRVLRLTGAKLAMAGLLLLSLANDAIANTVPGEPAVSSAYRYRYYRKHGATSDGAGWTIFTVLIAQAIAMSLILLLGVLIALTGRATGANGRTAVAGMVIIIAAIAVLARRDLVLRLAAAIVRMAGRGGIGERISATLERMRQIPLGTWQAARVVGLAAGVWLADFGCLLCAFRAVNAAIPWSGVLLAYCVAEIAGMLPVVPGGIGIVEGSLAAIMAAYGADRASALAAALGFRLVSFWLAIVVGWISVAAIARMTRRTAGVSRLDRAL